jgi:hypothetical protein
MKIKSITIALLLLFASGSALAQLEPWTDYDVSDAVWNMTTVKVDPNMGDDYLEGLRDSWVAAMKVNKELGQVEDFWIFRSQLPESGHANLFLIVKYASSSAALDPNKAEYDKFMEAWGEANRDRTREITKNYPAMRTITGEYLLREITVK